MDLVVRHSEQAGWLVVGVGGDVDLATAPQLRSVLQQTVGAAAGRDVAVDLRGVGFIDSIGLGVLIGSRRRVLGGGGHFAVVIDAERLQRTFEVAGLADVFTLMTSLDELPVSSHG
jgi:anti-sigma B factor antagonist